MRRVCRALGGAWPWLWVDPRLDDELRAGRTLSQVSRTVMTRWPRLCRCHGGVDHGAALKFYRHASPARRAAATGRSGNGLAEPSMIRGGPDLNIVNVGAPGPCTRAGADHQGVLRIL